VKIYKWNLKWFEKGFVKPPFVNFNKILFRGFEVACCVAANGRTDRQTDRQTEALVGCRRGCEQPAMVYKLSCMLAEWGVGTDNVVSGYREYGEWVLMM
jgi:hypothetical protein